MSFFSSIWLFSLSVSMDNTTQHTVTTTPTIDVYDFAFKHLHEQFTVPLRSQVEGPFPKNIYNFFCRRRRVLTDFPPLLWIYILGLVGIDCGFWLTKEIPSQHVTLKILCVCVCVCMHFLLVCRTFVSFFSLIWLFSLSVSIDNTTQHTVTTTPTIDLHFTIWAVYCPFKVPSRGTFSKKFFCQRRLK